MFIINKISLETIQIFNQAAFIKIANLISSSIFKTITQTNFKI
jgi:hypothetical protein